MSSYSYNGIVANQIEELPDKPRKKVLANEAKIGNDLAKDVRRVDPTNKADVNDILDRTFRILYVRERCVHGKCIDMKQVRCGSDNCYKALRFLG